MNQIAGCDWLLKQASCMLPAQDYLLCPARKISLKSHIINPLLTKFFSVKKAGSFFFCGFMDLTSVSVHKHAKKESGQYPAIFNIYDGWLHKTESALY